jgi:hypothetical protein
LSVRLNSRVGSFEDGVSYLPPRDVFVHE